MITNEMLQQAAAEVDAAILAQLPDTSDHVFSEADEAMLEELIQKYTVPEPKILFNRARCRKCGSFLESKSVHDLQRCSCGAIAIDGGLCYLRRLGEPEDLEELCEVIRPIWDETEQRWI